MPVADPGAGGPVGDSYGAAIVPAATLTPSALQELLGLVRFSGWIAPPDGERTVVLGDPGEGVVADGRRGIIEVAGMLAAGVRGPVLAVRVRHDRQLALVGWQDGVEVARYCSDPSQEPGSDEDVLAEPYGAEGAEVLAGLWGRTHAAEDLIELLEDELDPESVFESERLGRVLRLLGLPDWIVAAGALPRPMPRGPRASDLTRMRAGATGVAGRSRDALVRRIRRRQHPPPVIADPPTGAGMGDQYWMF